MNAKKVLVMGLTFSLLFCQRAASDAEKNFAKAKRAFERVQPGMSHADGCWYLGVLCSEEQADFQYIKDFGVSFSKNEYLVGMMIQEQKVVRVELLKPYYIGDARKEDKNQVVQEKGVVKSAL